MIIDTTPMVSISKRDFDKRISEAKAEVAREIFEEIESVCLKHIDRYDRYLMCCKEFAELKKKYTGNENG